MEEQNKWLDKLIALFKSGAIILWYYAVSIIVTNIIYAKFKNMTLYKEYVKQHEGRLMIVIYLMLFLGIWAFDRHREEFINFFKGNTVLSVVKYMLLAIGAYVICSMIVSVLLPIFPDYEGIGETFNGQKAYIAFIASALLPPIVEEYLFRHKIQGYLKKVFPISLAIIIQAVIFGALHGYTIQKLYAIMMGTFFGVIDEKEESVWPSIVMHLTINTIGWAMMCLQ